MAEEMNITFLSATFFYLIYSDASLRPVIKHGQSDWNNNDAINIFWKFPLQTTKLLECSFIPWSVFRKKPLDISSLVFSTYIQKGHFEYYENLIFLFFLCVFF
jgi:hypothetical protein